MDRGDVWEKERYGSKTGTKKPGLENQARFEDLMFNSANYSMLAASHKSPASFEPIAPQAP
jgi:hypothetical protein